MITNERIPFKTNTEFVGDTVNRFPETGTFREMTSKFNENAESYSGIAIVWDWRLAEMLKLQLKREGERYSVGVYDFISSTVIASDSTDTSEWKYYVELENPIKPEEVDDDVIFSDAIQQFEYQGVHYLLFAGKPLVDPDGSDEKFIKQKHEKLINKIHENTDKLDFFKLYNCGEGSYDDFHSARWGLLQIMCKWTNFDINLTRELFEGSYLFHPGWTLKNKDGVTTLDQAIYKILSNRPIFHKNEIEGYIKFHYKLRYNVITGKPEINTNGEFIELDDYEFNSIHRQIQNAGGKITAQGLKQLVTSDFVEPYDAFTEYFTTLSEWNETDTDWISELSSKVQTTNQEYWQWSFKKWIVGVVACALNPELTNQQVLVLSGKQGCGKSTFLESLLPSKLTGYLFSGALDPSSKDSLAHLAECMLINLDELDSLTRKKEAELKQCITQSNIKYRRPYGYFAQNYIRRASFMASVNHESILSDSSGSRRFLVHKVGLIDYQHELEMDKVYAQAYSLYNSGFQFWFDGKDISKINEQNSKFELQTPEEELLLSKYKQADLNDPMCESVSATEMLRRLYGGALPSNSTSAVIKLGQALAKHGFKFTTSGGQKKWRVTSHIPNR